MSTELALEQVRVGYGPIEVVHGVTMAFPANAITAILGPNGAGKTSTLAAVAGLVPLRGGRIQWQGRDISRWHPYRRSQAGLQLVPESGGVFGDLTVADNLTVFASGAADIAPALDAFPVLRDRLDQRAGHLSGGEQQMLAVSRALLARPRVLLLDELSTGLAPRITAQLFAVLADLAHHTTVILVEQYVGPALRLADVVYLLHRGEVAFAGDPAELRGRGLDQVAGYGRL